MGLQQLNVTLPDDMAELIKTKVVRGEYASESEVIRDGLNALLIRDRAMEDWLNLEVVPACDALHANQERGVSASHVRARLASEHDLALTS